MHMPSLDSTHKHLSRETCVVVLWSFGVIAVPDLDSLVVGENICRSYLWQCHGREEVLLLRALEEVPLSNVWQASG